MSFFGSEEWAIIESGVDDKIDAIQLGEWEKYEWDHFVVMKEKESDDIKWFDTKQEAIDFALANFDRSMISTRLVPEGKDTEEYYFG